MGGCLGKACSRPRAAILAACLGALVLLAGGCGSSDSASTTAKQPKTVREHADKLPKLPPGWSAESSRAGGFVLGAPPGWKAKRKAGTLTLLAPDRLVALTISADRTKAGLAIAPPVFASRTLAALKGYRGNLAGSDPNSFDGRYDGATVTADAIAAKTNVPQHLQVIALRRPGLVTFTVVIAANRNRAKAAELAQAIRIARTVRSHPANAAKKKPSKKKDQKDGKKETKK